MSNPPSDAPAVREETTPMEAGRELDVRVAVDVLGLTTRIKVECEPVYYTGSWRKKRGQFTRREVHEVWRESIQGWSYLHRYSVDISAAWEVVDKLMERAFDVHLTVSHESGHCCIVRLGLSDSAEFTVSDCDTMPLAICLAALQSVG